MTRKSTAKYQVVEIASGTVCVTGISKTAAKVIARSMQKGSKHSQFAVQPVNR